ncbi:MAG: FAD-dependent oxidoreductase, partial [Segetibacter sp.]|nr:FAD-dependent oxidoreductase [Segetibacter sp.]
YVEGYYSGEVTKTSAKAFLEEWMTEDEQQYRPVGGYGNMIQYLSDCSKKAQAIIHLSTVVKEIRWSKGKVEVIDESGRSYTAHKVIITAPLGIWTAEENAKGAILYTPLLPRKTQAAKQMGFGSVIKVLLMFKDNFYENELIKKQRGIDLSTLHMAITDSPIPTWWTQFPDRSSLLTGWLSGPKAEQMKNEDDEAILLSGLNSLNGIFNIDTNYLKENLQWWKVFNWTKDPFTRGSYSYSTLHTAKARKVLMEPVEDTLFFAGEALYDGPEMGTVEAALTSGSEIASKILSVKNP